MLQGEPINIAEEWARAKHLKASLYAVFGCSVFVSKLQGRLCFAFFFLYFFSPFRLNKNLDKKFWSLKATSPDPLARALCSQSAF